MARVLAIGDRFGMHGHIWLIARFETDPRLNEEVAVGISDGAELRFRIADILEKSELLPDIT